MGDNSTDEYQHYQWKSILVFENCTDSVIIKIYSWNELSRLIYIGKVDPYLQISLTLMC